jgi:hypothetical protein
MLSQKRQSSYSARYSDCRIYSVDEGNYCCDNTNPASFDRCELGSDCCSGLALHRAGWSCRMSTFGRLPAFLSSERKLVFTKKRASRQRILERRIPASTDNMT